MDPGPWPPGSAAIYLFIYLFVLHLFLLKQSINIVFTLLWIINTSMASKCGDTVEILHQWIYQVRWGWGGTGRSSSRGTWTRPRWAPGPGGRVPPACAECTAADIWWSAPPVPRTGPQCCHPPDHPGHPHIGWSAPAGWTLRACPPPQWGHCSPGTWTPRPCSWPPWGWWSWCWCRTGFSTHSGFLTWTWGRLDWRLDWIFPWPLVRRGEGSWGFCTASSKHFEWHLLDRK